MTERKCPTILLVKYIMPKDVNKYIDIISMNICFLVS